jgi:hypothetical protein
MPIMGINKNYPSKSVLLIDEKRTLSLFHRKIPCQILVTLIIDYLM